MANDLDIIGSVSTEKEIRRTYVKFAEDKDGKSFIAKSTVKPASQQLDKDSGQPANWANAEKAGFVLFNENEFIRTIVKTEEAFSLVVPEAGQRMYIIQLGLNQLQNSKANALMVAEVENASEPTPLYNQETIDLRVGIDESGKYSFNEKANRSRKLTQEEILIQMLREKGKTDAQVAMLLSLINGTDDNSDIDENETE